MKKSVRLICYIIATVLLVELDQICKYVAELNLSGNSGFDIIPGVFKFFYLQNQGAAWGVLSGKINLFIIMTLVIVAIIVYVVIKMPENKKYNPLFFTLIFLTSGAIGNFIDRVELGYVRDFIYFQLINFPVFNVADIYVTLSVIVLIILILAVYKDNDFEFLKHKKISKKAN